MKKFLSSVLMALFVFSIVTVATVEAKKQYENVNPDINKIKTDRQKKKYDIIKDEEYAQIKKDYFEAQGYGQTYNCKVEKQKFCKVKAIDTDLYVLCDREVSRTQMESAKLYYQLGRCVSLN